MQAPDALPMKTLFEIYLSTSTPFEESCFRDFDGNEWSAEYLYKHVKLQKLKVEKVCLRHLNLCNLPWSEGKICSIDDFLDHSFRVAKADLKNPIVMGWDGFIMDGWHRVCKAILEEETHINAYRFEKYLKPETEGKEQ